MENIVNLLVQVPLVGIFIWFILKRDQQAALHEEKRDNQWREFLKEEREHRAVAIGRMAEEIKTLASQVAIVSNLISAHDAKASVAIERIVREKTE